MPFFRHLHVWLLLGGMLMGMLPLKAQALREEACVGVPLDFPTRFLAPSGRIESWEWHFGDPESGEANVSSAREPKHTYQKPGTYRAMLVAFSDRGFADTLFTDVIVHPKPDASFLQEVDCESGRITLTPTATNLSRTYWRLGDGRSDTAYSPTFRYPNAGAYTISFWAETDVPGCRTKATQTLQWTPRVNRPRVKPASGCEGDSILLVARTDQASSVRWYSRADSGKLVGEGKRWKTPALSSSTQYYARSVNPQTGCESEPVEVPVSIRTIKKLWVSHRMRNAEELPARVSFQVRGAEEADRFLWDFGNGNTSTESQPQEAFTRAGTYPVTVEVSFEEGCTFHLTDSLTIIKPPKVAIPSAFSPNGDGVNDNFNLELSNLSAFYMQIFDRWGNLIFETRNTKFRWDGRGPTGKLVPEGVYICLIEGRDIEGIPLQQKELLTIIR